MEDLKRWPSTLKPILQSLSESQVSFLFATQENGGDSIQRMLAKYFENLLRNYQKIDSNTTTNSTQAKYFAWVSKYKLVKAKYETKW